MSINYKKYYKRVKEEMENLDEFIDLFEKNTTKETKNIVISQISTIQSEVNILKDRIKNIYIKEE